MKQREGQPVREHDGGIAGAIYLSMGQMLRSEVVQVSSKARLTACGNDAAGENGRGADTARHRDFILQAGGALAHPSLPRANHLALVDDVDRPRRDWG